MMRQAPAGARPDDEERIMRDVHVRLMSDNERMVLFNVVSIVGGGASVFDACGTAASSWDDAARNAVDDSMRALPGRPASALPEFWAGP
jgi:hypothetical protein